MVTIKDVARISGLSLGTVSNYLNGKEILPKNAEKIEETIKKLNFVPNKIGRSLRSGDTKTIGIITKDISASFISEISAKLEFELSKKGYEVIICDSNMDLSTEEKKIDFLIGNSVDAILIFPCNYYKTELSNTLTYKIPVILCDEEILKNDSCFSCVLFDNEKLAFDACEKLLENGHRNIACITGSREHYSSITRTAGFYRALAAYTAEENSKNVFFCDFNNDLAYSVTKKLLNTQNPPTAFFITSNNMLIGFLRAVMEAKKQIGKDVSYITFAHSNYYDILPQKPTYVDENISEFSLRLTEILEDILNPEKDYTPQCFICEASIIDGESIAKLN